MSYFDIISDDHFVGGADSGKKPKKKSTSGNYFQNRLKQVKAQNDSTSVKPFEIPSAGQVVKDLKNNKKKSK